MSVGRLGSESYLDTQVVRPFDPKIDNPSAPHLSSHNKHSWDSVLGIEFRARVRAMARVRARVSACYLQLI